MFCLSHKFWINSFRDIPKGHFLLQTLNLPPFKKISDCTEVAKKKRFPYRARIEVWGYIRGRPIVRAITTIKMCYYITSIWLIIHIVTVCYQYLSYFFIARGTCWGNIFLLLSFVRLKFHISTFITIFAYVLSFSFQSQYFEAVKGHHKVCIDISTQRTTLHFLFVVH